MDGFFSLSKIAWWVIAPAHSWLLLLILGLLCLRWRPLLGKTLLGLNLTLAVVLAIFPLGEKLIQPLEDRFQKPEMLPELGGIIILGGSELLSPSLTRNRSEFNSAADRVMEMVPLMKQYPDLPVIYTGGSGSLLKQGYRGADIARHWLMSIGLEDRVLFERNSRNTIENVILSKPLRPEGSVDKPWLLVTSAFHIPRSVGLFREHDWPVIPWPVDYYSSAGVLSVTEPNLSYNLQVLNTAVREWIGLASYYASGKIATLFPAPE